MDRSTREHLITDIEKSLHIYVNMEKQLGETIDDKVEEYARLTRTIGRLQMRLQQLKSAATPA